MNVPRLRMFAGPNGSGKSTIKRVLDAEKLGVYINPDEIQAKAACDHFLDLAEYDLETDAEEIISFFLSSTLLQRAGLQSDAARLTFHDGKLHFRNVGVNAYFASVAADFLRQKLIQNQRTFSFETVMSSHDKVYLLKRARSQGYRTYLYFIATEDPEINVERVQRRVRQGGHDVPRDKIFARYYRSLGLLLEALSQTNRAYLFDNSTDGEDHRWVAEVTDGKQITTKVNPMPHWFETFVWAKVQPQG